MEQNPFMQMMNKQEQPDEFKISPSKLIRDDEKPSMGNRVAQFRF